MIQIYIERKTMFKYEFSFLDKVILLLKNIRCNSKYYLSKLFPYLISVYRIKNRNYIKQLP